MEGLIFGILRYLLAKSELARISTDHLSTKVMVFGIYDGRDLFSSLLTQNIEQLLSYAENLF